MSRVSRPLLALALVVTLAGCAPDAADGTQRVEIEGVVTEVTASGSGHAYMLEVRELGFLALDLGDLGTSSTASGVVVEVPATLEVPEDLPGRFSALSDYSASADEPLKVVAYLP